MTHAWRIHGLNFVSELEIDWANQPETAPSQPAQPDVTIVAGAVAMDLPDSRRGLHGFQIAGSDALLTVPAIGRFLISNGAALTCQIAEEADSRALAKIVAGPVFAALLHQRGITPFMGCSVMVDGSRHVILGQSGCGASALATQFAELGYAVEASGLVRIDPQRPAVAIHRLNWLLPGTCPPRLEPLAGFAGFLALRSFVAEDGLAAAMEREEACMTSVSHALIGAEVYDLSRPRTIAADQKAQAQTIAGLFHQVSACQAESANVTG